MSMEIVKTKPVLSSSLREEDQDNFLKLISTDLSDEHKEVITTPDRIEYKQDSILAVHWHPEYIPQELILKRIHALYPNSEEELIIPTNHNEFVALGEYSGVEVDCYSPEFNRKVQLLIHFKKDKLGNAEVFRKMLNHTFRYRTSQLHEFLETVLNKVFEDRLQVAASSTGASQEVIDFSRMCAGKLRKLIEKNYTIVPATMVRNKLLRDFVDTMRDSFKDDLIDRAQVFLRKVKKIVKANFSPNHFYRTQEIIEEVRALGGGIVIPHPEQFWPILLADYDVDAYEVWNPQSREYTEFLINVVYRHNCKRNGARKPLLITMGDDCHMSEKIKNPRYRDPDKARREVGYQPAWDDLMIRKSLIMAGVDRRRVIEEYKARLD